MIESPKRYCCTTSSVLDKLAGICCMKIPKRAVSPVPHVYDRRSPVGALPPTTPKSHDDQMMQYIQNIEKQQAEVSKRKSRFVSEFRSQLVRIPLQLRTMDGKQSESFVLKESPLNPRLVGGGLASPQRKQRKVSDWAKKKNFSFKKTLSN